MFLWPPAICLRPAPPEQTRRHAGRNSVLCRSALPLDIRDGPHCCFDCRFRRRIRGERYTATRRNRPHPDSGWLGEAILQGARFANRKYSQLLDDYDLDRGEKDPPAGLNAKLRASVAELFGLAITGWARVLERAAGDAEATRGNALPTASLSIPTILATTRHER